MSRILISLALLLVAPGAFAAPLGDHVRLELAGPATPYDRVVYEVAYKRGTVLAGVDKVFAADFGKRGEVGLLTTDDLGALLTETEALGLFALGDRTVKRPRTIWTVTAKRGARTHAFVVHDPESMADVRYRAIIDRVRDVVDATVGQVPYRDAMLLPEESGRLRIKSTPIARAEIDGVPLEGTTPMADLRLTPGKHAVRLTPLSGGEPYDYDVHIDIGRTTSLVVELR